MGAGDDQAKPYTLARLTSLIARYSVILLVVFCFVPTCGQREGCGQIWVEGLVVCRTMRAMTIAKTAMVAARL